MWGKSEECMEKGLTRFHCQQKKISNTLDHQITTSKFLKPERNSIADPSHKYKSWKNLKHLSIKKV